MTTYKLDQTKRVDNFSDLPSVAPPSADGSPFLPGIPGGGYVGSAPRENAPLRAGATPDPLGLPPSSGAGQTFTPAGLPAPPPLPLNSPVGAGGSGKLGTPERLPPPPGVAPGMPSYAGIGGDFINREGQGFLGGGPSSGSAKDIVLQKPRGAGADLGSAPGGALLNQLNAYASGVLQVPSRYDIGVVKQGLAQIDKELANKRRIGVNDLEELASRRGLVGSSVEMDQRAQLISDLERERSRFGFDLAREMARTQAADRAAAGAIAQGAVGEGTSRFATEGGLALRKQGLEQSQLLGEANIALQNRAQQLQELGMDRNEAFRRAQLEQSTQIQQRAQQLQELGMNRDEAFRYAQLELQQQGLDVNQRMAAIQLILSRLGQPGLDKIPPDVLTQLQNAAGGGGG